MYSTKDFVTFPTIHKGFGIYFVTQFARENDCIIILLLYLELDFTPVSRLSRDYIRCKVGNMKVYMTQGITAEDSAESFSGTSVLD